MLKIRLTKIGKKHAPAYRISVMPEEWPQSGKAVEILGHFNPSANPPSLEINKDRLRYWLEKGAQPTAAVEKLVKGKYEFKPYFGSQQKKEDQPKANGPRAQEASPTEGEAKPTEAPSEEKKPEPEKEEKPKETPKEEVKAEPEEPKEEKKEDQPKADEPEAEKETEKKDESK